MKEKKKKKRIQQAEREGGEYVLVFFNNVIPCSRATRGRVAGGSLLTVAAILVYISETGRRARVNSYLCVFQSLFSGVFSCVLPALYFLMYIADKQQDEGSIMCFVCNTSAFSVAEQRQPHRCRPGTASPFAR